MAPLCILWSIWKERNRRCFDNEEMSVQRLKLFFLCNFFLLDQSVYKMRPFVSGGFCRLDGVCMREGVVFLSSLYFLLVLCILLVYI